MMIFGSSIGSRSERLTIYEGTIDDFQLPISNLFDDKNVAWNTPESK